MAKELNPEATLPSEIEPKKQTETLNETTTSKELNEFFEDMKHLDDVGNVADENAIWVYFGVGGPA
tara:strand:- start:558 stop:755 length:198 start_codon:yes stop_codon:yes gene_type:complete